MVTVPDRLFLIISDTAVSNWMSPLEIRAMMERAEQMGFVRDARSKMVSVFTGCDQGAYVNFPDDATQKGAFPLLSWIVRTQPGKMWSLMAF